MYGVSPEYYDVVDRFAKNLFSKGFLDKEINHSNYFEKEKNTLVYRLKNG